MPLPRRQNAVPTSHVISGILVISVSAGLLYDGRLQSETVFLAEPREIPAQRSKWLSILLIGLAVFPLWLVCCRYLSAEWSFNEQYNYGWFVPFFAAYLFWERWRDRP